MTVYIKFKKEIAYRVWPNDKGENCINPWPGCFLLKKGFRIVDNKRINSFLLLKQRLFPIVGIRNPGDDD